MSESSASVYDHYRTKGEDYEEGVYRVVGVGEGTVTLLRVGDGEGRRANTGELTTVATDEMGEFERCENPDGNRHPTDFLVSIPETGYWSVVAFAKEIHSHPVRASLAMGLFLFGYFGESIVDAPDSFFGALVIVGSLLLAYVGSGRV